MPVQTVSLSSQHDRAAFRCGTSSLDRYLHVQAGQDARRDMASVYVLEGEDGKEIRGFYTLSAYGIQSDLLPDPIKKQLPRYDTMPAYLIGRLAVDERHKGKGIGKTLLLDALQRCVQLRNNLAAMAVIVDAIDDHAAAFYKHYHFQPLLGYPHKLFIPMNPLIKMVKL